jgi:hypothetical protein
MIDPFAMVLNVIVLLMNTLVANNVHFVVMLVLMLALMKMRNQWMTMMLMNGKRHV